MSKKILIADDEIRMRKLVGDFLRKSGYEILEAEDGEKALEVFFSNRDISLVILDVMMPKKDGFEVCREIRKNSKVPVIMLTARSDESDELLGFEIGVDEYVTKPFSPKVLVARVDAVLRRSSASNEVAGVIVSGGITLDRNAHQVLLHGEPVELSVKEFELLSYFIENSEMALSREQILNGVWNYDYDGDARTVDTHVKKLRNKLKDQGKNIVTIWGMGYKYSVAQK